MIQFWISGSPIPTPRPRVTMRGKFPHAYTPKDHGIWAWRMQIKAAALPHRPRKAYTGPLWVRLCFYMPRPQAHAKMKQMPCFHTHVCDVDNMFKGVADTLTDLGFWVDDSQICEARISKLYATAGKVGCFVQIARPNPPQPTRTLLEV